MGALSPSISSRPSRTAAKWMTERKGCRATTAAASFTSPCTNSMSSGRGTSALILECISWRSILGAILRSKKHEQSAPLDRHRTRVAQIVENRDSKPAKRELCENAKGCAQMRRLWATKHTNRQQCGFRYTRLLQ
jgi:hypothetical protein